ncbi:MAG: biotin carboxylase [bacterium]|nr:biotin carboxylase [bacterium]
MTAAINIVGVTALNATDNPGPGVAVARSLRNDSAFTGRIIGLAYDALDPGVYAGLFDAIYLIPYPSEGQEALGNRLAYIVEQTGMNVCIPTLDSELPGFIALEKKLQELKVATFMPTSDQFAMRSKERLDELGNAASVSTPDQVVITSADELYNIHTRIAFPLVVKGIFYGAEICHTLDQAVKAFNNVVARWGVPVIVQEFLDGTEFDVVAVGDGEGGLIGAVPMKKMQLTDKGKGWSGVVVSSEELAKMTTAFMKATRWRGPCELEIMETTDGRYLLLEVNPRFPAWCYLAYGAGLNLPLAVVHLSQGKEVEEFGTPEVGAMFVRISLDQITHINAFEQIVTSGEFHPEPDQPEEDTK